MLQKTTVCTVQYMEMNGFCRKWNIYPEQRLKCLQNKASN